MHRDRPVHGGQSGTVNRLEAGGRGDRRCGGDRDAGTSGPCGEPRQDDGRHRGTLPGRDHHCRGCRRRTLGSCGACDVRKRSAPPGSGREEGTCRCRGYLDHRDRRRCGERGSIVFAEHPSVHGHASGGLYQPQHLSWNADHRETCRKLFRSGCTFLTCFADASCYTSERIYRGGSQSHVQAWTLTRCLREYKAASRPPEDRMRWQYGRIIQSVSETSEKYPPDR